MEFTKKETVYHFNIPQLEKLVLTGIISKLLEEDEIKVDDKETKDILKSILNGLKT
jgi:hypothetical protein